MELLTEKFYHKIIKENGEVFRYINPRLRDPRTKIGREFCLVAIRKDPKNIIYIGQSDPEFNLEAVKENGHTIKYIHPQLQTSEICHEAIKLNGKNLQYIHQKTPELCIAAINQNEHALNHIDLEDRTPEIYHAAVKKNGLMLQYIDSEFQTEELLNPDFKKFATLKLQ
jgi:hypothetical protein